MRVASLEELRLMVQAIHGDLVGLVGPVLLKDPTRTGEGSVGLGSGLVLEIGSRLVAVTAAHNFEHGDRLVYGLLPKWSAVIDDVVWLTPRTVATAGGGDFDAHDIAVFEVSKDETERWGVDALPLERVMVYDLGDNEFALLHGFPFKQADIEYGGKRVQTRHMTFATAGVPVAEWDGRYRRGVHHVLRFPQDPTAVSRVEGDRLHADELPDPGGISGSGVWIIASRDGRLFSHRDLTLVGIEYAWSKSRGTILANTMAPVLKLIQQAFPDLAGTIDSAPVVVAKP